jgi:glycosyltransferase involved in cell wall biosynthesis
MKTLSIITVTYNSAKTLQKTIDSISAQKSSGIEFIIIDGNSTDGTVDLIKKNSSVVDHWVSEKDKGIYDAMNKGIALASGKYIGFMNSDDWYEKDVLTKCLPTLENSSADIIYGDTNVWSGDVFIGCRAADEVKTGTIPWRMPFSHQSCFILGSIMREQGGFNTQYKLVADFNMIIPIIKKHSSKIDKLPYAISGFSVGGASSNILKAAKERYAIHLKHGMNAGLATLLYTKWISMAAVKAIVSPKNEIALRKFKTKFRL